MKHKTPAGQWLLNVMEKPLIFPDLEVELQDLVLRLARGTGLLARLDCLLREAGIWGQLSPKVQSHLVGARVLADEDIRMMRWEVDRIQRALYGSDLRIILLKGAAYLFRNLAVAQGRVVADVDILLAREDLDWVEARFIRHGWEHVKLDPYDQRYYRQWMHELPPLRHRERLTELDVHHTILPKTSRLVLDADLLRKNAEPIAGERNLWTLSPVDMTLHAVVHLFYDNDFGKGLRGLVDLDGMFRHFGKNSDFWQDLPSRARQLDLARPLYYALRYGQKILKTPLPDEVIAALRKDAPPWLVQLLMDFLIPRVVMPEHPERPSRITWLAWGLLFIRSHWLRMPPRMLLAHLTRKWVRTWRFDVRNRWNI